MCGYKSSSQRRLNLLPDPLLQACTGRQPAEHLFGHLAQLFDYLFGAAVAAGWALTVTIVDADVNLSDLRLWPLNHAFSSQDDRVDDFIAKIITVCTRAPGARSIHRSGAESARGRKKLLADG